MDSGDMALTVIISVTIMCITAYKIAKLHYDRQD
jgi:hypothetical protein